MKVIIAPDSFKGCLSAKMVALAMERGIKKAQSDIETIKIPMADGGEGTVEAILEAVGGRIIEVEVLNPLGEKISAIYGILPDNTAVIEMAAASGINLINKTELNPLITTTYGTGQLIADALTRGCRKIIIGIGGSATNDCGAGMMQALGAKLLDAQGMEIGFGGGELDKVIRIDTAFLNPNIAHAELIIASDVKNPLCGPNGASAVYGPQKGATPEMVEILDNNLSHFAKLIKNDLGKDLIEQPGAGAAGGLGAGLIGLLNAEIKSGINIVMEVAGFEEQLQDADYVITGEGATDFQSVFGKVPFGIGQAAQKHNVPVLCVSGSLGNGFEKLYEVGITALFSIVNRPMALSDAIANGEILLEEKMYNLFRLLTRQ